MAAPNSFSTLDLSGSWTLNESLSDPVFRGFNLTKAPEDRIAPEISPEAARHYLAAYELTLKIKHYKGPTGIEHLDMRSVTRTRKRIEIPQSSKGLFKKTAPEPEPEPEVVETTRESFVTLNGIEQRFGSDLAKRQKAGATSRRVHVGELEAKWYKSKLEGGWDSGTLKDGVILSVTRGLSQPWHKTLVYGLAEIEGQQRLVSLNEIKGVLKEEQERMIFVYDYGEHAA